MSSEKVFCEILTWEQFEALSRKTADKIIKSGFKPDIIVGIARGGWCLARLLCDFVGVKDLLSLKVEHWGITATPDGEAKIKYPFNVDLNGKKVLIVDDISDTGKSLTVASDYVKTLKPIEVKTATLMLLKGSTFSPDYYGEELKWRWVVFPWNYTEDMCNLVHKVSKKDATTSEIVLKMKDNYSLDITEEKIKFILKEIERRNK